MARHSSPRSRHALEIRRTPAHRRPGADDRVRGAADTAADVHRLGGVVTLAGSALSLAGAGAAGWVAAAHMPNLLDVVLPGDTSPAARTVTLLAAGSDDPAEETVQPGTFDAAALVTSTQRAGQPVVAGTQPAPRAPAGGSTSTANPAGSAGSSKADNDDRSGTESGETRASDNRSTSEEARSADVDRANDRATNDRGSTGTATNGASSSTSGSSSDSGDNSDSGSDPASDSGSSSSGDDRTPEDSDQDSETGSAATSGDTRTTGASSALSATGGPRAQSLPSEIIDTGNWYLTLPTGAEGDPDTVQGSTLASYHSKFFQLNKARNAVVFTASTDGATTSGSKYPRSELREMIGSDNASWDGRKGRHTMEIVQAITETPKSKPDVIAGQIHATSDDLMQVHLSGNRLTVKYADGKESVDLDPNYTLGTMFGVKIESSDGRVKVWYNGVQKADLPISSSSSYFKAGAYVNSNPSKGDASGEGQVVIRSLSVKHE